MFHYEIILMINPEYSDQISDIIKFYTDKICNNSGIVHRIEDWGKKQLAFKIKNLNTAHYILLNIEICKRIINEILLDIRYNNKIIRSMHIKTKYAITTKSPMLLKNKDLSSESNNDS